MMRSVGQPYPQDMTGPPCQGRPLPVLQPVELQGDIKADGSWAVVRHLFCQLKKLSPPIM